MIDLWGRGRSLQPLIHAFTVSSTLMLNIQVVFVFVAVPMFHTQTVKFNLIHFSLGIHSENETEEGPKLAPTRSASCPNSESLGLLRIPHPPTQPPSMYAISPTSPLSPLIQRLNIPDPGPVRTDGWMAVIAHVRIQKKAPLR